VMIERRRGYADGRADLRRTRARRRRIRYVVSVPAVHRKRGAINIQNIGIGRQSRRTVNDIFKVVVFNGTRSLVNRGKRVYSM